MLINLTVQALMSSHLQNTFLNSFSAYISIFQAFILDPLHAIEQGEHGKHLWPWLCEALPESSLSEIDSWYIWLYFHGDYYWTQLYASFKQCSQFPHAHHFRNGVTGLKYITSTEHGQILRVSSQPGVASHYPCSLAPVSSTISGGSMARTSRSTFAHFSASCCYTPVHQVFHGSHGHHFGASARTY